MTAGQTLACFVSAYFAGNPCLPVPAHASNEPAPGLPSHLEALREVCVLLRGEPPSALDRTASQPEGVRRVSKKCRGAV